MTNSIMLLTVPYDESMRLGQGFNSYTQSACMYPAVSAIGYVEPTLSQDPEKISQSVSVSSQFVTKISNVVSALNISPASCIKARDPIGGLVNLEKVLDC
jgi:hypothetical protein